MKKLLLILFLLITSNIFSQSYQATVDFQKGKQPAAAIDLPYSTDIAEAALKDFMLKRSGSKAVEGKGLLVFRNSNLGGDMADLYFKLERKSRKEKGFSTIFLMPARVNENLSTRTTQDNFGVPSAQQLLNELAPLVTAHGLEAEIKEQEEVIAKSEKRFTNLVADSVELQKRRAQLDERIATNSREQLEQKEETRKQREALEVLMKRRKD